MVVTPGQRECLVGLAWAISDKYLHGLYIIIGLVAAYWIWGIKIKSNLSHLGKQPSFVAAATLTAKMAQDMDSMPKSILSLGKSDLYGFTIYGHFIVNSW